jgi:hypothetical protein
LQVLWYKDTMRLDTTETRIMESRGSRHTLIIRKVQQGDFANYTCMADNQIGKNRKKLELSGKYSHCNVLIHCLCLVWVVIAGLPGTGVVFLV